jgi:hypothetical protein
VEIGNEFGSDPRYFFELIFIEETNNKFFKKEREKCHRIKEKVLSIHLSCVLSWYFG